jgi:arginyl-tRNA synthetase
LFVLPVPEGIFLRLFFNKVLPKLLIPYIRDRGRDYGRVISHGLKDPSSPDSGRKKVVVEFSSPNIIEEFKVQNLRSTLLGSYIANLHENVGWEVVRINYLGDWGNNIGLFGVGWPKFGSEEQLNDYRHLAEVYSKVDELHEAERSANKKKSKKNKAAANGPASPDLDGPSLAVEREEFLKRMENRDPEAIKLWNRALETTLKHYEKLYERLNVRFDEYAGESKVSQESMAEVEEILKKKGLTAELEDGSCVIDLAQYDARAKKGITRRHGSSTYFLRDLGAILDRYKQHNFDKMVYVLSADQEPHFRKVMVTMGLLDDEFPGLAQKIEPVYLSRMSKAFEAMESGRPLEEVLDDAQRLMKESLLANEEKAALLGSSDEVAALMGIDALFAEEMSARKSHDRKPNDHAIEISKLTSFVPGTSPFMQYTYARAQAVITAQSADENEVNGLDLSAMNLSSGTPCQFTELLRLLIQYPNHTTAAYENGLESHTVVGFLHSVTSQLATCLDAGSDVTTFTKEQREVLEVATQVLENGMTLLGIRLITS